MSLYGENTFDAGSLYALLPATVRQRDQAQGGGILQALVGVIAAQAQVVSDGLDQMYDDQFIETCAIWVAPYIGDLIGFTPLQPLGPGQPAATRAEVADTIGYRRRKGTLGMLEQLCFDVTGWPGIAVEYFTRISTTQYVRNHLRPENAIVDVHSAMTAVDIGSAFDAAPRTVDVRRIASGRGRYNIPNVGMFVWRLASYKAASVPARYMAANQYTFDPFGGDVPLANPPATTAGPFDLLGRANVPFFLQLYPLYTGLQPYAAEVPSGSAPPPSTAACPVAVKVNGTRVADDAIGWCDLTDWRVPTTPGVNVAVDPVLGRLVFATAPEATDSVEVDFTYTFSGNYGGGYYPYPAPAAGSTESGLPVAPVPVFASVGDLSPAANQVLEVGDSGVYASDLVVTLSAGILVIKAADLQRPVVAGDVTVTVPAGTSQLTLRGLGIEGAMSIEGTGSLDLDLQHCSVRGGLNWSHAVEGSLALDHTLCGPLSINPDVDITLADSAVDAGAATSLAISAGGGLAAGSVTVTTCTVVGEVSARTIPMLSDSIVTGPVTSVQRQAGCLRYSYVPLANSTTPRRFRCQPDLEIANEIAANPGLTPAEQAQLQAEVETWLQPVFTSVVPGQPAYLQLADSAPAQISAGAEEGDEMGVFNGLYSGRRESNLSYRLNEYLRIGLQAGIIHTT